MKWILDMALRNLKRNKRRTILAISSITLSVMLITFLGGFVGGMLQNMVKNLTKNETGHVRIVAKGFEERSRFMPVDELIAEPEAVMEAIETIPELQGKILVTSERILFGTLLSNGPNTKAVMGFAGDPENEKKLLNLDRSIVEGRYLHGSGDAIIGAKLAEDLGFALGDDLRVVTQGADYGLHLKKFEVVGIVKTGLNMLDAEVFQVPVADVKQFLRTDGGVQQILVMLKDYTESANAAKLIAMAIAGVPGAENLVVRPWTEIGEYPTLITMMETMYGYMYWIVAFLGAFIITNILMMVVLERKKEIGILKSMGLRRNEVMRLFLAEGAIMGVVGSAIGAVLGLLICFILSHYGLDFSSAFEGLSFPIDPVYYAKFDVLQGLQMFVIGVVVSILVSISPSRRAATMNVVDAIKSVA
ncbi:MAG: ABC transporter permease [Clostridia bacterium]|jgi:putative ABC transport system permease protein|nr:ABC transporter permease [Spirochaetia bacterium]